MVKSTIMELISAYTLSVSGSNSSMIGILKKLDNTIMSNTLIKPIYEPHKGDLVFFKSGNIGFLSNNLNCIYYNKDSNFIGKTEIVMNKYTTVRMFGRVDTTKRAKTVVKQHFKHFQRYMKVRSIIEDASQYYDVPNYIVKTIIYNESKFNNNSKSHTGVTGIGMFTDATAKQFGIDKTSIDSQIYGVAKVLRHNFNNLPDYYSNIERWELSALIYNRGKGIYFKSKRDLSNRHIPLTYKNVLRQINRYKYGKEGVEYVKRLNKYKYMFK